MHGWVDCHKDCHGTAQFENQAGCVRGSLTMHYYPVG
jgi:hypothetical protein